MIRQTVIPQATVYESIQSLQEFPERKLIRVVVGKTNADGVFLIPQEMFNYEIKDESYDELVGIPTNWATDKPTGTYRNEDLWHYIDLQRNANA